MKHVEKAMLKVMRKKIEELEKRAVALEAKKDSKYPQKVNMTTPN